jgi:hypothetical protein
MHRRTDYVRKSHRELSDSLLSRCIERCGLPLYLRAKDRMKWDEYLLGFPQGAST